MFHNWKNRLTSDWNFIRIIRLALSILILTEGIKAGGVLIILLGSFILVQTLLNAGCCSTYGCATNPGKQNEPDNTKDITFEEIK